MTVRDAIFSDAPAIAALAATLGYPAAPEIFAERLARLRGREDHIVLVATCEDAVAGWLHAHVSESLESGFRAEIVGLVVAESFRRRGVGKALVMRAEQWARDVGAEAIVVRSNTRRLESHRFYPALGFTETKTQAVYRKRFAPATPSVSSRTA